MDYRFLTPNIIVCENFLPVHLIDKLYDTFETVAERFVEPQWANVADGDLSPEQTTYAHCGGKDFWYEGAEFKDEKYAPITNLSHWFFDQGFGAFIRKSPPSVFQFMGPLDRKLRNVHVVAYNNGGYYNWHVDNYVYVNGESNKRKNYFTFALTLMKNHDKCTGGDQLFMDEGRVLKVPLGHNILIIFPSYIHHAMNPMMTRDGKDLSFQEQRFNVQFWVTLGIHPKT